jgi:hypothetical protein
MLLLLRRNTRVGSHASGATSKLCHTTVSASSTAASAAATTTTIAAAADVVASTATTTGTTDTATITTTTTDANQSMSAPSYTTTFRPIATQPPCSQRSKTLNVFYGLLERTRGRRRRRFCCLAFGWTR